MKRSTFIVCYVLICAADLFAVIGHFRSLEFIAKPLIVLSLSGYYFYNASPRYFIFIAALLFSCLGDVLLLFESSVDGMLIYGLLSFLISHLLFIQSYRHFRFTKPKGEGMDIQKARMAFPVLLAGTGLVVILYPGLGALRIPVIVYAFVITAMVLTAVWRLGFTDNNSFRLVFYGALLFLISDSILAVNKFHHSVAQASLWIMITYCAAQFMIVEGILQHPKEH